MQYVFLGEGAFLTALGPRRPPAAASHHCDSAVRVCGAPTLPCREMKSVRSLTRYTVALRHSCAYLQAATMLTLSLTRDSQQLRALT